MPGRPGRKKVRCPKCTALFSEPSKPVFECPICACRLSANGALASTDGISNSEKERHFIQAETPNKGEEASGVQSQQECSKDGGDSWQDTVAEPRALSTHMYKDKEQPFAQIAEVPLVSDADFKEGKPSADDLYASIVVTDIDNSSKENSLAAIKAQDCDNLYASVDATANDNSSKENSFAVIKAEEIQEEDTLEKSGASKKHLQLQTFQATRCEFSFKYSIEGALDLESDCYNRRFSSSKFSELEKVVANTDSSDASFHTPLRVRIINSREESSDQSEHGRYSFSSDTDSQDGSESEFDFPAPWAEGLQVRTPIDSSSPDEVFLHQSSQVIPATPHQLELRDDDDILTVNEGSEIAIPSLLGDSATIENKSRDGKETSNFVGSLPVADLANHISSVALNDDESLVKNGSPCGMKPQGGQETVCFCDQAQAKDKGIESSNNTGRKVSSTTSEGVQALDLIAQHNGTDDCTNIEITKASEVLETLQSTSSHRFIATVIPSIKQDPLPASCLHSVSCENEVQWSARTGESRLVCQALSLKGNSDQESKQMLTSEIDKGNCSPVLERHLDDGLVADTDKVLHAYTEPDTRSKNMFDHLRQQDTEMELDLYSHQEVDEWQDAKEEPIPPLDNCNASLMRNRVHHLDLQHLEGQSSLFSDYAVKSAPLANTHSYGFINQYGPDHYRYEASSSGHMYNYQVPSQAVILPAAFPNQVMAPFGYHTVSNACMVCSHHHHPRMQTHLTHPCTLCLNHPGSIACNSGLSDHWSCHQAHHHPAPAFTSSLVACTPGPLNLGQRYDFPITNLRLQASLSSKVSQYPPLPKNGASPYFTCKGCNKVLQIPLDLPPNIGCVQKLRCSACHSVTKFSVEQTTKQRQMLYGSSSVQLDSPGGAAYTLPLEQYNVDSMASSLGHDMRSPKSPWTRATSSDQALSQVNTDLYTSRSSDLGLQGADYLRGRPREEAFDDSMSTDPRYLENIAGVNGLMSTRDKVLESTNSAGNERTGQRAVASLHEAVDEKDEGLDFGAPRISDGDSLDQSESRMRSPEDIQVQRTCTEISEGAPLEGCEPPPRIFPEHEWIKEPVSAMQRNRPGSPLLVLLNQGSTKFIVPRDPSEGSGSASWSPASDSPLADSSTRSPNKKRINSKSTVTRGPKYIAGLLRRSLRDISKGGQYM